MTEEITGHTPGPWEIAPEEYAMAGGGIAHWRWIGPVSWKTRVSRVVLYDGEEEQQMANARLIAAAPDLLEALKECHRALMHYEWYNNPASGWAREDNNFVRYMTDTAIAKATTKQESK